MYQDLKSDNLKLQRMVEASFLALNESLNGLNSRIDSIDKKIAKDQILRLQTIHAINQTKEVYKQASNKLLSEIKGIKKGQNNFRTEITGGIARMEKNENDINRQVEELNHRAMLQKT